MATDMSPNQLKIVIGSNAVFSIFYKGVVCVFRKRYSRTWSGHVESNGG